MGAPEADDQAQDRQSGARTINAGNKHGRFLFSGPDRTTYAKKHGIDERHDHIIDTGKGSFELSELGRLLPGMAEIMPLVGDRMWKCYYACAARNQAMARFQLSEAVNLMKKGAALRPKYREDIQKFVKGEIAALRTCIQTEDWDGFPAIFAVMVAAANNYHEGYNKAFLRWRVPDRPPPDLDMEPRGS